MNQEMLNEVVKRAIFEVMNSSKMTEVSMTVEEVIEDEGSPCDNYISALEDMLDDLRSENSDLKEELAERTIDDLLEENEFLHDELRRIKYEHNCTIDMIIELLQDEKL
jgi:predicted RNase H-like nuclease (RuvC/YqgF family)